MMYNEHFGLRQAPFRITPDTSLFYTGGGRGDVLEALVYAITSGEGIVKVVGEVGTGKTMLCRMLEERLPDNVQIAYLANPSLTPDDILHAIALELGLELAPGTTRLQVMHRLQETLLAMHARNRRVVALVEEAQRMPVDTLEEIRLLSNLETKNEKLLQIVLFGQPELDDNLALPGIRQLRERITHSFKLAPLARADIQDYVAFRLRAAGYRGRDAFSGQAYRVMSRASEGLTRRVNIIADKAMLAAFAENTHDVSARHVKVAIRDSEFDAATTRRARGGSRLAIATGIAAAAIVAGAAGWFMGQRDPGSQAVAGVPAAQPGVPLPGERAPAAAALNLAATADGAAPRGQPADVASEVPASPQASPIGGAPGSPPTAAPASARTERPSAPSPGTEPAPATALTATEQATLRERAADSDGGRQGPLSPPVELARASSAPPDAALRLSSAPPDAAARPTSAPPVQQAAPGRPALPEGRATEPPATAMSDAATRPTSAPPVQHAAPRKPALPEDRATEPPATAMSDAATRPTSAPPVQQATPGRPALPEDRATEPPTEIASPQPASPARAPTIAMSAASAPASAPAPAPAPAAQPSAADDGGLLERRLAHTRDWLERVEPGRFSIQLLATDARQRDNLEAFLRRRSTAGDLDLLYVYATRINERRWFGVLYGEFDSVSAAREALRTLPEELLRHAPFIRNIRNIRSLG